MPKRWFLLYFCMMLLCVGCTQSQQSAYDEQVEAALQAFKENEYTRAQNLLKNAVAYDQVDTLEAERLQEQLDTFTKLEQLISQQDYEQLDLMIGHIHQIETESMIITDKADDMYKKAQKDLEKTFLEKSKEIDKLIEEGKTDEATRKLQKLKEVEPEGPFYEPFEKKHNQQLEQFESRIELEQEQEDYREQ